MFTGIVEGVARLAIHEPREQGVRLVFDLSALGNELRRGDSVALNGACLTVAEIVGGKVSFDLAGETLRRTNLGRLRPGDGANYERALRLGDRLDGHLVQGHVDGVGVIREFRTEGDDDWLVVGAPDEVLRQSIFKGSIAVNGISLTIAKLEADRFACTILPHTRKITNLAQASAGDPVNLEVDMVGKWIARLVEPYGGPRTP